MIGAVAAGTDACDYEQERATRVSENLAKLNELMGGKTIASALPSGRPAATRRSVPPTERRRKRRRALADANGNGGAQPRGRASKRIRGIAPDSSADAGSAPIVDARASEPEPKLLTSREYMALKELKTDPLVSDGQYKGWVNDAVAARYGIAGSSQEAWEREGGGKFSFKIAKGGAFIRASIRRRPIHTHLIHAYPSARAHAHN